MSCTDCEGAEDKTKTFNYGKNYIGSQEKV